MSLNQKSERNHQKTHQPQQKCRSRIDQLAIPSRRLILALYQEHSEHLPKEKVEKLKVLLQELYAMTPEETEKYFEYLRQQSDEVAKRKNMKFLLRKLLKRKKRTKQVTRAYAFVKKLLIDGMTYATKHPLPPFVSVRLRNLSNIILEQICDLKNVKIPIRDNPDSVGHFLIQVADWMAIAVEQLYYVVQLKKNEELDAIENKTRENTKKLDEQKDGKDGEEKGQWQTGEDDEEAAILSEALLVSEME
ncbi:hypothetical protein ABEB36_006563 [Hypothenemus hampei]|uniref:Uncharacterized protein n=1 Tax=Hypothenemus hampei TaxID=57062 RepID=A0ABD1ERF7_HYPHA